MNGRRQLNDSLNSFNQMKGDRKTYFSALLGALINGENTVQVSTRPGYVWIQMRNASNEVIQAYNSIVPPIYGLPVLVERDPFNMTRYTVVGRDLGRYDYQSRP